MRSASNNSAAQSTISSSKPTPGCHEHQTNRACACHPLQSLTRKKAYRSWTSRLFHEDGVRRKSVGRVVSKKKRIMKRRSSLDELPRSCQNVGYRHEKGKGVRAAASRCSHELPSESAVAKKTSANFYFIEQLPTVAKAIRTWENLLSRKLLNQISRCRFMLDIGRTWVNQFAIDTCFFAMLL